MTGQSRRQPTNSTNRGRRWFTVLITMVIAVLLVVFGAQLAYGPSENNIAEASTPVTPVSKPATAVANAATPVPTGQTAQTAVSATPAPTSMPTPTSVPTPPATETPPRPTITEGASTEATSAITRFVQQNGTTLNLGSPTSAPFTSGANDVAGQYFANAVLEYHPEFAGTVYAIELSRVGVALANANNLGQTVPFQALPASTQGDANCWFVQATYHRLCAGFRNYWRSQGLDLGDPGVSYRESLALFGYPISEEFTDPASGLTVQYFERGVLTYDENKAPADRIHEQTATEAILNRWHFQIITSAASLPSGG